MNLVASLFLSLLFAYWVQGARFSQQLTPGYDIEWDITNQGSLRLTGLLQFAAWAGIGWHCDACLGDKGMLNVDFAIAVYNSNGSLIRVYDRYSNPAKGGFAPPLQDTEFLGGVDNIMFYSGFQRPAVGSDPGFSQFTFEKLLSTGDVAADHPLVKGNMRVIWAHGNLDGGNPNVLSYHHVYRGEVVINWFNGTSGSLTSTSSVLRQWHGALMVFAFTICLTLGAFVARYLKNYFWWFPMHIILQVSGVCIALVSFGIAVYMTNDGHFTHLHTWVGLGTLSLGFLAPVLGWLADLLWDPKRGKTPWWPDMLHWWAGRLTILGAYASILLGLYLYGANASLIIVYAGVVAFYFFIFTFLEVYKTKVGDAISGSHGGQDPPPSSAIFEKFKAVSLNVNQTI